MLGLKFLHLGLITVNQNFIYCYYYLQISSNHFYSLQL